MTEIIYCKDADKTKITVSGHSNAPRVNGADLCCCSVSILVFTLMKSLMSKKLAGYRHSCADGLCTVSFDSRAEGVCEAYIIIDTVMNGFDLLKKSYPDNIRITVKTK